MRSALAAVAVVLVVAPAAGAATVRVGATGAVDYAAAPGEANTLVASASGTTVTLADDRATIVPGAGCSAAGAHRATCTTPDGFPSLSADLGDGDDRATVTGLLAAVIDGGSGNDVLAGGDARDVLDGGPGDDDLRGGAEDDTLFGDGPGLATDDGADRLDGGPGADVLDCGPGADAEVDADAADRADGCEQDVSSAPPATPPPPATEPTRPESQTRASDVLDPGIIVPLQQASPAPAIVPVALTLRAPTTIARGTLRRTGLRVTLACSTPCRATLRLARSARTLVRRTVTAGRTAQAVRLRARTGAGTVTLRVTAPDVTTRTKRVRVR